jgi:PAS domain S-box-containing protein
MSDPSRTKSELIKETSALKKRIKELERSETERKRAEEALQESEAFLNTLLNAIPIPVFYKDRDGRYLGFNRAFETFFGAIRERLIGKTVFDINPPELAEIYHTKDTELFESGEVQPYESQVNNALGVLRDVIFNKAVFTDRQGAVSGLIGTILDITEQEREEAELRQKTALLEAQVNASLDGIIIVDKGRKILQNQQVNDLLKIPRHIAENDDDEVQVKWVKSLAKHPEEFCEKVAYMLAHPDKTMRDELEFKDGTVLDRYSSPVIGKDGKHYGRIWTFRDITECKHLESQLLQAQKMEAIGTLAGGVAHDFNNILTGIQGYTSLMMLELDTHHPHYERLKRIEEQIRSASGLAKQLLGFACGGRYEVRPINMNEIIRRSSPMFGRTKKELTVHGKYEKDLWTVEVDRGQIEQVLLNLYVNAWHAMPEGGELYLETSNVAIDENYAALYVVPPGNYVRVCVADTGVGMEEETKKRIFDPFFTTKEMGRGTGLGLAMVYGIMKGHKGFVDVYSKPGHGTTFTLYLPASEKKALEERPAASKTLKGSETILLVDDEPAVLAVSKKILESLGYTVHGAGNGQEAIAFYREMKNDIDLVILDVIMPGLSGSEAFDRIRELNPSVKVILSSGYSLEGQAQQIMDRGCRGFIQKPFDIARLSRKVREVLEK